MATEAPAPIKGADAVDAAAGKDSDAQTGPRSPGSLDAPTQSAATAWFMSTEVESTATGILPVNVAPAGQPEHVVDFTIQVVDRDRIRELRKESEFVNAKGEREVNEMEANLRVAVEGLVDPNLADRDVRTVDGEYYADPADALRARFAYKPGLIDQIATKISQMSGYNDADVKEIKAAGN
jgi:Phage XkdN-like tail assembly chaperone protein, TAC